MSVDLLDIDAAIETDYSAEKDLETTTANEEGAEETTDDDDALNDGDEDGDDEGKDPGPLVSDGKDDDDDDIEQKKVEPQKPPQKVKRADKRVSELLKERYELRRELDEVKSKVKPDTPKPPEKPDPKDYKYDPNNPESIKEAQRKFDYDTGKYESDLKAHNDKIESKTKESESKRIKKFQSEQNEYNAKIEIGKKAYPDYDEAFSNISEGYPMTEALHVTLLESDDPAGILRFLGKHTAITEKILSMGETRQARKLAEIDLKLKLAKDKKINKTSKAPTPPKKVGSGSSGGKKPITKMTAAEYHAQRTKKKK